MVDRAFLLFLCLMTPLCADGPQHVVVYREPGRFGGWPANHGIWSWGDEIVVGIRAAHFQRKAVGHAVDASKPQDDWQARSLDGGRTWNLETPPELRRPDQGGAEPVDCPGGIDFTHSDFALMFRQSNKDVGPSRFYYSLDRARTWKGPYKVPAFDTPGIAARTDYLVNGKHNLTVFLTAGKSNRREGRVLCSRTTDGGKSWQFVSWIGPEPAGFAIMPSSVRLSPSEILTTMRRKEGDRHWIDAYLSEDDGRTWRFLNRPAESTGGSVGNPPSLIRLRDGRLAITYGYRSAPYGIRARLSSDNGRSWGEEIILRKDGGCWDLGYPRTVQRRDGKVVTVYYFNDYQDQERYIAATIWDP